MNFFYRSGQSVLLLKKLLRCGYCHVDLQESFLLKSCGHFLCRSCVEDEPGSSCRLCGVTFYMKDIQPSKHLEETAELCLKLILAFGLTSNNESHCSLLSGQCKANNDNLDNEQLQSRRLSCNSSNILPEFMQNMHKVSSKATKSHSVNAILRKIEDSDYISTKFVDKSTLSDEQDNSGRLNQAEVSKDASKKMKFINDVSNKIETGRSVSKKMEGINFVSDNLEQHGRIFPSCMSKAVKRNFKGETALHIAAIKGDVEGAKKLLTEGANVNVKDNANWTPLHEACNHGHTEVAKLLLDFGALINMPGNDNVTPLHDAVENNRFDCIRLLVSRGASKTMRNIHGQTALDLAVTPQAMVALDSPVMLNLSNQMIVNSTFEPSQPVVILTTSLSSEERTEVKSCVETLGWKFLTVFSSQVTHIITMVDEDGSCPRTFKYLQAVLSGKWILNIDWITTCLEFKKKVSEESFEVAGSTLNPKSFGPCRGRENMSMQLPGLFSGCNFFFQGKFVSGALSRKELTSLIILGCGNILTREPKLQTDSFNYTVPYHASPGALIESCGYYIVQDGPTNKNASVTDDIVILSRRLCRVTPAWILACISEFRLLSPIL